VPKKPTNHEKCQLIIERLLGWKEKIGWPAQMKLLKSLLKKYPDHGFWLTINPPQTIGSFAYFKTKEGKQFVEVAHRFYKTSLNPEQKEVILGDKIGKDENIKPKKPKTLKEFLNAKTKKDTDAGS